MAGKGQQGETQQEQVEQPNNQAALEQENAALKQKLADMEVALAAKPVVTSDNKVVLPRGVFGRYKLMVGTHHEGSHQEMSAEKNADGSPTGRMLPTGQIVKGKTYVQGDIIDSATNLSKHNTPGTNPKFIRLDAPDTQLPALAGTVE